MADFRYVIADVFTDRALAGNQLAVFTDAREIPEELLQPIAREMNFSETAFVYRAEGDGHARIRIFTPQSEADFAGHPALGAAFVLAGPLQLETIRLETNAGVVPVDLEREGARIVFGRMRQPVPKVEPYPEEAALLAALRVERSELPVELYDPGIRHVLVALPSVEAVSAVDPDMVTLGRLTGYLGTVCFAGEGRRWRMRMFAPGDGIPEDPATGSAVGPLAVHLGRHGVVPFGEEIEVEQGVEIGRPSRLYARAEGTVERVELVEVGGAAVVVGRGELRL